MRGVAEGRLWKVSTFTALGLAAFLALHPIGPQGGPDGKGPAGVQAKKAHASGGILAWLSGASSSDTSTSAPHTGTHIVQLRNARNMMEECEALRVLGIEAAGDEEAIGEIADRTGPAHARGVRQCAISALEKIPIGRGAKLLG